MEFYFQVSGKRNNAMITFSKMLHMPLKLKWGKKSGRYDLSQDIYVLTVYLGDYAILQCTLTTESSASQCMEYLRQKVDLNQVSMSKCFFTENFLTKKNLNKECKN